MVSSQSEWPSINKEKTTVLPIQDDTDLCDVPFQRFESPRPPSTPRDESTTNADSTPSSFVEFAESSSEPFTSVEADDISTGGTSRLDARGNDGIPNETEEDIGHRTRPHSENSIASVWKSVATTTQIFSDRFTLCGGQQGQSEEENNIPFHPSDIKASFTKATDSIYSDQKSTAAIQLRHVQSTSAVKLDTNLKSSLSSAFTFDESQMRRSSSAPAKFQPGRIGSAFGQVPSSSSNSRKSDLAKPEALVSNIKNTSAFYIVEDYSNSKHAAILSSKVPNDIESVPSKDKVYKSSKRSFSARVQQTVKMKRRERMYRNGKDKSPKVEPKLIDFVSVKTPVAEKNLTESGTNIFNNINARKVEGLVDKNYYKDRATNQEGISYLPFESENILEEEENILGVAFADISLSGQQALTEHYNRDSPTALSPPAYHKITDDEQAPIHIPSVRQRHYRRHTRTPPTPVSPSNRASTPQPPKVLSLKATLQGNMSPCSQDSCAQSRMTSRSGYSNNTSNQTLSTSLSGSCTRSVTSSVAEADREVRDTNRRELRRRHINNCDGAVSVQSCDTTSTNPHTYLALTSNPAPPREGASLPVDRFFSRNAYIGLVSHNTCGLEGNQYIAKHGTVINSRSSMRVDNHMLLRNDPPFGNEEPPRFVSCTSKQVLPPLSRESVAYSKLCSDFKNYPSSSSSASSSSRSKKKDKTKKYQKMTSSRSNDHTLISMSSCNPKPIPSVRYKESTIPPRTSFSNDPQKRGSSKLVSLRQMGELPSDCYMSVVTPEKV